MSPTYDYMNKQASFHSRQGRIWRLGLKFLLVRFDQNWHGSWKQQLLCPHSTAQFDKQCGTLCLVPQVFELLPEANTWAPSRCRSTAWSLGAVRRKFSDFKLIPLNIHPRPTIFIAKAAITLNDFSSVSYVNLLMNKASSLVPGVQKSAAQKYTAHAQK